MVDPNGTVLSTSTIHRDILKNEIGSGPLSTKTEPLAPARLALSAKDLQAAALASTRPAAMITSSPVDQLAASRLVGGWLQLDFAASCPEEVRLQACADLATPDWHELEIVPEFIGGPNHYQWLIPSTADGLGSAFFRVVRGSGPEKASAIR